jgi:hypothetical protein
MADRGSDPARSRSTLAFARLCVARVPTVGSGADADPALTPSGSRAGSGSLSPRPGSKASGASCGARSVQHFAQKFQLMPEGSA